MRLPYVVVATLVTIFGGREAVLAATESNQATLALEDTPDVPVVARALNTDVSAKRFLRIETTIEEEDSEDDEERALPSGVTKLSEKLKPTAAKPNPLASKLAPMTEKLADKSMAVAVRLKPIADTFTGKLKPIADKLMPILKPLAEKLKTAPSVNRLIAKLKTFAEKIKNYKVGEHTIGERYTMAKFELWFKQNKTPDDVKAMLKVGEGAAVNTKNYDLSVQYNAFYRWAQRDKEVKAAAAAAA
ncbi:hypothetical protein PC116_g16079 [Phytophthora cactorum]|uniref:RxLR effector protein n=1 Tax=Phytophthora cactorum TaxID=29920 RepID=A0A329RFY3_9STRA|nr:hypothetical protein PC111_g16851 [Phytophthora cactorum]KAG2823265.1 hypothetical protein PC112_g10582 [Phytophthora cactorum]KAG2835935.1 hypothetical protein PC113_g20133 [Phytophthora cactorum]KAG2965255.1 hypothetical protein PC118_g19863 [Phytophthora cactorum]KAG3133852.1 hypothetical protein C6341_g22383 [Phytophthora cactorum]